MRPDRQAIVVIHGIGNQQPMGTLRGFVETFLGYVYRDKEFKSKEDHDNFIKRKYWSAPDRNSNSIDLRMLVVEKQAEMNMPTSHFYEYYWAHKMEGSTLWHVVLWFFSLLFKRPWYAGQRIERMWYGAWLIVMSVIALVGKLICLTYEYLDAESTLGIIAFLSEQKLWVIAPIVILLVFTYFFTKLIVAYAGDAARYYRRTPSNIANRQQIIADGVALLKRLNDSGDYNRMRVVGHSLGSQIAYDITSIAWASYKKSVNLIDKDDLQGKIKRLKSISSIDSYQLIQKSVWESYQNADQPWIVSDLITMGSPLAHAPFLLAKEDEDFEYYKLQKELCTCPPELDGQQSEYFYNFNSTTYLHHAAVFALVRWTNLCYEGDLVGGDMTPGLGSKVRNINVEYQNGWWNKWISTWYPLTHNSYFYSKRNRTFAIENKKEYQAIEELSKAIMKQ